MKHIETIKTCIIVFLVTGIVAFVAGVKYQTGIQDAQALKTAPEAPKQVKN